MTRRSRHPTRATRRTVLIGTVAVAVIAVGVVAATTRDSGPTAAVTPTTPSTTIPPTTTTTTAPPVTTAVPRDPRRGNGQTVTLAFAGDTHFENHLRDLVASDPQGGFLSPIAPLLQGVDVTVVNLETPVTDGSGPPAAHQYVFHAPSQAFTALRGAGISAVTMANNHAGDYGIQGVTDSLAAAHAAGFPVVGIGADATEAFAAWRVEVRGQRIAVIGITDVYEPPVAGTSQPGVAGARPADRAVAAVRAARTDADTVVVFVHWGEEGSTCPSDAQRALERQLVSAGADIVVGAHTHVQQGAGRDGSAFVAYGLGNFIWYNETGDSGRSGVLQVKVTGRDVDSYRWAPARIQGSVPRPLEGTAADAAVAQFDSLRGCAGLTP